jgi:uncharacterized protein (UPF0333 family)
MKNSKFLKNKRGQIWVETVIYILIAFVMIGLVLSFVKPKIEELRDKAVIEQSIEVINNLDSIFSEVLVPGNKRVIEIGIKKGEIRINSENDTIEFVIESEYIYSEPGETIYIGEIIAKTETKGKYNLVTLRREYFSKYNITYQNLELSKTLTRSSVPYKLVITNEGEDSANKILINLDLI